MLKLIALFIGLAHAQNYLPQADIPTAQTRSQQMCQSVGCDGVFTKWWWPVQPLTDSTAAIVIAPSGLYGATVSGVGPCAVGCGLTAQEQSQLQTATQMGTKLPWVISEPTFMARFTPIQISAANNSGDPNVSTEWQIIKGAATVNLQNAAVQSMVAAMVTDGIITAANAQTILAPVAVAVLPP